MVGYWNRPDETADVLRDHIDRRRARARWLHTGDLGYLDDDGYLFIVDRKKDLIKTSGYQVWPREIEEVLAAHPAVAEVGVAGVPDATKGEVGQGLGRAARRPDGRPKRSCARSAASKLAPYKVPVDGRVPDRAAEDDGRQGAAPRAQRRSALVVLWSNFAELDSISPPRRLVAAERD